MTTALVVGGPHSFVQGTFKPHLSRVGIEVVDHWPYKENRDRPAIPTGVEVVLALKDMLGHSLFYKVKDLAKAANIPIVQVPRKFAKAFQTLKGLGLVSEDYRLPDDAELVEAVATYLVEQGCGGALPSRGKIRGFVQQTYGIGVSVSSAVIQEARAVADERQERIKKSVITRMEKANIMNDNIREACSLVFDEKIEATDQEALKLVRGLLPNTPISGDVVLPLIQDARERTLARYRKPYAQMSEEEQRVYLEKRERWLRRTFREKTEARMRREGIQDPEMATPTYRVVAKEARRLWGSAIDNIKIRDARREVLAEMKASQALPQKVLPAVVKPVRERREAKYNKWGYTTEGLHQRVRIAHNAVQGLDSVTARSLAEYVQGIQRRGTVPAKIPSKVLDFMMAFRGNQLGYSAALVLLVPEVNQRTATILYKKLFRKGLGCHTIEAATLGMVELDIEIPQVQVSKTSPQGTEPAPVQPQPTQVQTVHVEQAVASALEEPLRQVYARLDAIAQVSPVEVTALSTKLDEIVQGITALSTRMAAELRATQEQVDALRAEVDSLRGQANHKPAQEMTLRDLLAQGIGFELKPPAPAPTVDSTLSPANGLNSH